MELAPIVLFVYNRPWHTRQTLEALKANDLAEGSKLIIYCDGPKLGATKEQLENISEVRNLIREKKWCGVIEFVESDSNKGLAASVIEGVTEVVNKYGKIIVLEDDLITSPFFLNYMNEGLYKYRTAQNVYSINGYMFPIETDKIETVLLPYTSSWGWGTWKEKWAAFDHKMPCKDLILENQFLKSRFNLGDYPLSYMLERSKTSWAIFWYYSVFIRNGLGVFPTSSLVNNIGFDGSGVHYTDKKNVVQLLANKVIKINNEQVIDLNFYNRYLKLFKKKKLPLLRRGYAWIKKKVERF
jgi:hypothetical protein